MSIYYKCDFCPQTQTDKPSTRITKNVDMVEMKLTFGYGHPAISKHMCGACIETRNIPVQPSQETLEDVLFEFLEDHIADAVDAHLDGGR